MQKAKFDDFVLPELHAELKPFLRGDVLNHPLLQLDPAIPAFYPRINKLFTHLKQDRDLQIAKARNEWSQYEPKLTLMEKQIHFLKHEFGRTDPTYFRMLGQMWTDLEMLTHTSSFLEMLLGYSYLNPVKIHPYMRYMMTEEEQSILDSLPDMLTVYRGHERRTFHGLSWTLDCDVALQYAFGHSRNHLLTKGRVDKSDAIAFIERWDESEILVSSDKVRDVETFTVKEEPTW